MTNSTTVRAQANIEVSDWSPTTVDEPGDGPTLNRIAVRETFSGDIVGEGRAEMLQVLAADGSASFVAVERITGRIGGRSGSFVLQDRGTLGTDGTVSGEWSVVPGSGAGELAGLGGEGGFTATLGQHAAAWLDYRFDAVED